MTRLVSAIRSALAYLIFLPNVTPARVLFKSEIFPWAFLFSIRRNLKIPKVYIYFVLYLTLNTIILGSSSGILVPTRALFALINSSFIFIVIQNLKEEEYTKVTKALNVIFGLILLTGLIQYLGVFPEWLADVLRLFIDRIQTTADIRGVSGLYSEPAYMSYAVHSFFLFWLFKSRIDPHSKKGVMALLLLAIYDLIIIRSLTDIILLSIIILAIQKKKNIFKTVLIFATVILSAYIYFDGHPSPPRSIDAIHDFIDNQHYRDPLPWLLDFSGFRLASVWGSYRYGIINPFGCGLGNWGRASIDAIDGIGVDLSGLSYFAAQIGIDYPGVRPSSFAADLMLETGVVGFVLFVSVMAPFLFSKKLFLNMNTRPILACFAFNCFFLGTIGDPIPFITFGMVCREMKLQHPWSKIELFKSIKTNEDT